MKTIKDELLAIQAKDPKNILRAEAVRTWAQAHPRSKLYAEIEWNTTKAALEYQLWQIRRLIALNIVSEDGTPEIVSLTIDRVKPGGGYRSIIDVVDNKVLAKIMLADALQDLARVQLRYARVKELTAVWALVDKIRRKHAPDDKKARAQA